MSRIVIGGKAYEVVEEVAQLILDISKERDELKLKLDPSSGKAPGPSIPEYPKEHQPKA